MIELIHPWFLALLPLPILAYWLLPASQGQGGAALRLPFHRRFGELGGPSQLKARATSGDGHLGLDGWVVSGIDSDLTLALDVARGLGVSMPSAGLLAQQLARLFAVPDPKRR